MEILLIIGLLIFSIVVRSIVTPPVLPEDKKDWCPPHIWQYGNDGFLICKRCNNKPGYKPRDNNNNA